MLIGGLKIVGILLFIALCIHFPSNIKKKMSSTLINFINAITFSISHSLNSPGTGNRQKRLVGACHCTAELDFLLTGPLKISEQKLTCRFLSVQIANLFLSSETYNCRA